MQPNPILATWGQIAGIILVIELFFFVLIALLLNALLMFLFAWIREKAELVKKLRPAVDSVNAMATSSIKGSIYSPGIRGNKVVQTVTHLPAQMHAIEEKVEQGTDRVASAVIEFRARTVMVQGIIKAFFLPGLMARQRKPLLEGPDSKGLAMLGERASAKETGNGHMQVAVPQENLQAVGSAQRKNASPH